MGKALPNTLTVLNLGIAVLIQLLLFHIGFGDHDYFILALGLMGIHTWVYMSAILIVYASKNRGLTFGQVAAYIFLAPLVPLTMISPQARVVAISTMCMFVSICLALLRVFGSQPTTERLLLLAINYFSTVSIYGIVHFLSTTKQSETRYEEEEHADEMLDHESWYYLFLTPLHTPLSFAEFSIGRWRKHCRQMFEEIKMETDMEEMRLGKKKSISR